MGWHTHSAAPTTDSDTAKPMPVVAHMYGDVASRNQPTLMRSPLPVITWYRTGSTHTNAPRLEDVIGIRNEPPHPSAPTRMQRLLYEKRCRAVRGKGQRGQGRHHMSGQIYTVWFPAGFRRPRTETYTNARTPRGNRSCAVEQFALSHYRICATDVAFVHTLVRSCVRVCAPVT